jgi:hypothetical protein
LFIEQSGGRIMNAEEKLKELVNYITVMTDYYQNVLFEEKTDSKKAYIKGKLDALSDMKKRLKKLDIEL